MTILLLAYACQPNHGSEPKNGWQWASRLSQVDDVYLLTHPRGRQAIDKAISASPKPRLHVEYVELPAVLDPWESVPTETLVRLRYVLWQIAAYLKARRLVRTEHVDVVHHTTWASMSGPTFGWALGKPFVWGPVGGGQKAPLGMRSYLGLKAAIKEALRNVRVSAIRMNLWARLAARSSAVALASNCETAAAIGRAGASDVRLMLDTAVDPAWMPEEFPERKGSGKPIVLWMGRLEAHKALNLALEAFAHATSRHPAELWVLGDGPLRPASVALAKRLGLRDSVKFLGWVPYEKTPELFQKADVFLFTSLRDSCPQPVLEALAWGLPAVSLDHQGLKLHPDDAVLKVPVTTPAQVASGLGNALVRLLCSPSMRRSMGHAGWSWVSKEQLWPHRIDYMRNEVYLKCLARGTDSLEPVEY
jgi:glycosyltransferase involved in cell wall biosynthesis